MKMHLMMITAMLSFCVTHNSQAQNTEKKDKDAVCDKAEDCKSNVCTDKKCAQGTKKHGELAGRDEECASGSRTYSGGAINPIIGMVCHEYADDEARG